MVCNSSRTPLYHHLNLFSNFNLLVLILMFGAEINLKRIFITAQNISYDDDGDRHVCHTSRVGVAFTCRGIKIRPFPSAFHAFISKYIGILQI